jgi:hypothetical protein
LVPRIAGAIHYDLCCHRALLARSLKLGGRRPSRLVLGGPYANATKILLGAHVLAPSVVKSASTRKGREDLWIEGKPDL